LAVSAICCNLVEVHDGVSTEQTMQGITRLRKRRHIAAAEDGGFSVRDLKEIAQMLNGTTRSHRCLAPWIMPIQYRYIREA
jgi:hypothetical protein